MIIRMNAVSHTEQIPYILGVIQGVHCEGEVAEVLGQWWVQLGRHHKFEVASQYPFLPSSISQSSFTGSQGVTRPDSPLGL